MLLPIALARTGDTRQAMMETKKLWLVVYSHQENVIRSSKYGAMPEPDARRLQLCHQPKSNEVTLANLSDTIPWRMRSYLASNSTGTYQTEISSGTEHSTQHPYNRELIIHGIRLAGSGINGRRIRSPAITGQHTFKVNCPQYTYSYVGRHWASTNDADSVPENLAELLPVDLNSHPELVSALIRLALRHANREQVLRLIHRLPKELQLEPRWQYWKARVLADSADTTDKKNAEEIYRELAELRNIYGFLAADLMQLPYIVDKHNCDKCRNLAMN